MRSINYLYGDIHDLVELQQIYVPYSYITWLTMRAVKIVEEFVVASVLFLLALFVWTWKKNPKTTRIWNILNTMVCISLCSSGITNFVQIFALNIKSEQECSWLHHTGATSFHLGSGLTRVFFAFRFAILSPFSSRILKRGLTGSAILVTIWNTFISNATMDLDIDPVTSICIVAFNENLVLSFILEMLILDFTTTTLLVRVLLKSQTVSVQSYIVCSRHSQRKNNSVESPEPSQKKSIKNAKRSTQLPETSDRVAFLTKLTVFLCLFSTIYSIIPTLMALSIIPVDGELIPAMYAIGNFVSSSSAALPSIIVRFHKRNSDLAGRNRKFIAPSKTPQSTFG